LLFVVYCVERKRLQEEFRSQYQGVNDSQLMSVFESNEDVTVMKINTHGGQDAFVYFMLKNPAFFELDKVIYPTGLLSVTITVYFLCILCTQYMNCKLLSLRLI